MLGANDQRHILYDPMLAVDLFRQSIERPNVASGAGFGESGLGELSLKRCGAAASMVFSSINRTTPLKIPSRHSCESSGHRLQPPRALPVGVNPVAAEK